MTNWRKAAAALLAAGVLAASAVPAVAQNDPAREQPAAAPSEQAKPEQAKPTQQSLPPAEEVKATEPGQQPAAASPQAASPGPETPASEAKAPGAAAPGAAQPNLPAVDATRLPHDLSPIGMFMNADWIVKGVMIGLAFASLVTWSVWLAKSLELAAAGRQVRQALKVLGASRSLEDARRGLGRNRSPIAAFVSAADAELAYSEDALSPDGVKERVVSHLTRLEAQAGRKLTIGTGLLATIGATAPFVGLFGTVWGIMNSFIGISNAQTTNLAVVAPGIAEALLATAIGLVAAIPAVVIYNVFARAIGGHRALLSDGAAAVLRLVSRDLDRNVSPRLARAAE